MVPDTGPSESSVNEQSESLESAVDENRSTVLSPGILADYMYKSFEIPIVLNYSMERKTIFVQPLTIQGGHKIHIKK